jgi:hypothetical protein
MMLTTVFSVYYATYMLSAVFSDTYGYGPPVFLAPLCFHRHSRFVPQESYQLSAISRQASVVGLTSDS